ncbi:DNA repair protein RadA [Nakamurella antarctica]|uniref:DNA repair protein RadA n=1 Tax=Nakamurella antarctica TaxID=1902245 RepID=A0A3G8ZPP7_9ACTN|nr:DNA repair protein RadA [Nakamurella antarctica]AZI58775.1 DNA repair protein RadA [Nakamurella antarctica]
MATPAVSKTSAAKAARPSYSCTECGNASVKWHGRCPECQAWGTMAEAGPVSGALRKISAGPVTEPARPLFKIDASAISVRPSGIGELDRVLGGGLVPGSVVLLAGEPGVGKSTLLLAAAQAWAARGNGPVLIITGEESAEQVRLRAGRIGALHPDVYLAAETELSAALSHIDAVSPGLLIVDSVQTIAAAEVDGSAGGVTQVRAVASALTAVAKKRGMATVLVGHVTKDGAIAGPRVLEHLVDVVLHFEGDRHSSLRLVRGVKNRFGPSDEVGCFQMAGDGIVSLADPSGLFLSARRAAVPGTCATIAIEGRRALPVEIQTLVTKSSGEHGGRRSVAGLATPRVDMVIAVLQRWAGLHFANNDVMSATVGGAKMTEPAADLALAMALWSSQRDIPLAQGLVIIGELGLSADVRPVSLISRRLAEAKRLGFNHALVPVSPDIECPEGMQVDQVDDLGAAFRALGNDAGITSWLKQRAS